MRATCPGARSGRISITTLPLVVSSVSVSSGFAISLPLTIHDRQTRSAVDGCLLTGIHARHIISQIGIAFVLDAALVGTAAVRRALAIFGVKRLNDVHSG